jgi:dGTPase
MATDWQSSEQQPPERQSSERQSSERQREWVATMGGVPEPDGIVLAHCGDPPPGIVPLALSRASREDAQDATLAEGATRAFGAGTRVVAEEPDDLRTCFERDRDRILHSTAFRRLAGKTQVFVFPADHQRTRLTHALEVAQVATAIARAVGLNVALTEAIALGHDCGHGPGGHASEDAFDLFVPGGYHHAIWGADVVLSPLNLCVETLDGIRNHSWSLPTPATPEGAVVSWADRCAYSAHDLEDAVRAGIVAVADLPAMVTETIGITQRDQLSHLINAIVDCIRKTGLVGMATPAADALAALRAFNYEHIYNRPASIEQGNAVVAVLTALVEHFIEHPALLPAEWSIHDDPTGAAVTYVAGMTDRFAFDSARTLLDWPPDGIPHGIDSPTIHARVG